MKIISLLTAAGAILAISQVAALAQQEAVVTQEVRLAQDAVSQTGSLAGKAFVHVSFGAVMMQVPVSLAIQLCPGADADEMAAHFGESSDVACAIPHEAYTSHPPDSEPAPP